MYTHELRFCFVRRHSTTETIVFQTSDDISLQVPRSLEAEAFPTRADHGQLAWRHGAVEYKVELDALFPRLRCDLKRTQNSPRVISLINLSVVLP